MRPVVADPFVAARDVHAVPTLWPVPNVGFLPMNAFVIRSAEPVLVDTGVGVLGDQFLDALSSVIQIDQLKWIWLTHEDRDHTGSLYRLLELAPRATVIADFFAIGRISPERPFPLDRLRVVTPGDRVTVGDRDLVAVRPPLFDSPSTTGLLDDRTGVLFSSDCFGAPLPSFEEAAARSIADVDPQTVARGQIGWATADSPWVTSVDQQIFARSLDRLRRLEPTAVLSSHLPPAHGQIEALLANLAAAPNAEPMPGTTQAQLDALLASLEPAGA
jgi:glyoxylase-like metal-dependent hydrolase (beta-lactamase superfamily II)